MGHCQADLTLRQYSQAQHRAGTSERMATNRRYLWTYGVLLIV